MKKLCAVAVVVLVALFTASTAEAKLSFYAAETAAKRYAKGHCTYGGICFVDVGRCRRIASKKIDCTAEEELFGRGQMCIYTIHVVRVGYSRLNVWPGARDCFEI